jgi:hypothetical protein
LAILDSLEELIDHALLTWSFNVVVLIMAALLKLTCSFNFLQRTLLVLMAAFFRCRSADGSFGKANLVL